MTLANNTCWKTIKKDLEERFKNKKIVLIGFGREGISTYRLLKKLSISYELYVMDQNPAIVEEYLEKAKDQTTHVLSPDAYLNNLDSYDFIFKTPGLPGFLLKHLDSAKILSQSELFMEYMGPYSIGITGTKGKSTTSSLVTHVLSQLGLPVRLVGNIGYPALECLETHTEGQIYVYEMSSFQTEFLQHGPRIRVVLNLFEEHLNNYESYKAYQDAKLQLFLADNTNDKGTSLCVYGADNSLLRERISQTKFDDSKVVETFGDIQNNRLSHPGVFIEDSQIYYKSSNGDLIQYGQKDFSKQLIGDHNLMNSLVVINVIQYLSKEGFFKNDTIDPKHILALIGSFKGLEHRLEYVGTHKGIAFYNDSISTIPEATIQAIHSIPNLMTLIIGGFDRGINYSEFTEKLMMYKNLHIICLPDTGYKIYQWASEIDQDHVSRYWHLAESMDEAVRLSYQHTLEGKSCLLSPAASSYNCYKNFEERGDHFKQKVRKEEQIK